MLMTVVKGSETPVPQIISSILGLESCIIFEDDHKKGIEMATKFNCNIKESKLPDGTKKESTLFSELPVYLNCQDPGWKVSRDLDRPFDAMPTTFNYPVFSSTLANDGSDFEITLSDGTKTKPVCAILAPADENNEGHTAAIIGEFGGREEGTWPKSIEIVSDTLYLADIANDNKRFKAKGAKLEWSNEPWKTGDT